MQWLIDIVLENFKGMILMWSGGVVDIPAGWHLCDGTGETPDLRNKFVPGAGDTYNPGDAGGADSQTHSFTGDGHAHGILDWIKVAATGIAQWIHVYHALPPFEDTTTDPATGTTDAADNRPQYYSLAYIMKL